MREIRSACRIVCGKPEGKRRLLRPRHRQEYNIEMDHIEIQLAHYRVHRRVLVYKVTS
jgi:hypothetical protein